ncbi:MAG: DUF882 domain-containing protein [Polyangiaceae bacterium]|nr:DUF882 domain-containing protein [Polyangiaceae bacterium]
MTARTDMRRDGLRVGVRTSACALAALGAMALVVGQGGADDTVRQAGSAAKGAQAAAFSASVSRRGLPRSSARDSSARQPGPKTKPDSPWLCLPALHVVNLNTHLSLDTRLYDGAGNVDEQAGARLDILLGDMRDPKHPRSRRLERRTLQLVYRAAYHFDARTVEVVSAYRAARTPVGKGPHASGRAIDFRLSGVSAATLAAYLRQTPRAGVGVYTHRRTQYVHLDTRETSHHWLDASPPGSRWRELSIGPRSMAEHDVRYRREEDWPEGLGPPGTPP